MGGLGNVFKRILPLIMIICFLCLGITHIFKPAPNRQLTYLTQEVKHSELTNTDVTYYKFDTNEYMANLNSDVLKRSLQITNTLTALQNTIKKFSVIWEDGYQLFDITRTIANAIVLVINVLLAPINFLLIPIRISMAILLTTLTIIGINIGIKTGLIKFINDLVDFLEIPLINPLGEEGNTTIITINGTTWNFYEKPDSATNQQINFIFYDSDYTQYKALKIEKTGGTITNPLVTTTISFQKTNDTWITVYQKKGTNSTWTDQKYKKIIVGENNITEQELLNIYLKLGQFAQQENPQSSRLYIKQKYAFC